MHSGNLSEVYYGTYSTLSFGFFWPLGNKIVIQCEATNGQSFTQFSFEGVLFSKFTSGLLHHPASGSGKTSIFLLLFCFVKEKGMLSG